MANNSICGAGVAYQAHVGGRILLEAIFVCFPLQHVDETGCLMRNIVQFSPYQTATLGELNTGLFLRPLNGGKNNTCRYRHHRALGYWLPNGGERLRGVRFYPDIGQYLRPGEH